MLLQPIDWLCVFLFFAVSLAVGVAVTRKAGSSAAEFFAAGRSMPWWLLGVSMVATTFSTDTPNLVTNVVRQNGVSGNWEWWAFLLTGMLTVFVYAQLWRRSGVLTDVEFYELRYSGRAAAFLRGFRALYLGVFFNTIIMASVTLAAIKIGSVLLNLTPMQTILVAGTVTVIYSSLGGLRGVLITDFFQFIIAMIGAVGAAYIALGRPEVGGLQGLLSHPELSSKLSLLPDFSTVDKNTLVAIFIMPLAVQWWSVWYPGSEPGGGGYIAQRMLAAKDEKNAVGAVFLFNAAHYALRPWPWMIVALSSLLVFPTLDSLREAFPHAANIVGHDMAYPAMLTFLPAGLLGVVVASLIAAYMSTISTHLNWGASYVVNDFYLRFVRTGADEREQVLVGRVITVVLMILAGALSLVLESAKGNFDLMLQVGAGTGLLFILRWFWWRVNAAAEIAAMVVSFAVAVGFFVLGKNGVEIAQWMKLLLGVGITTLGWIVVMLATPATSRKTLVDFYRKVHPGGPGWRAVAAEAKARGGGKLPTAWRLPQGILCMVLGCMAIYGALFATGYWLYGQYALASVLTVAAVAASAALAVAWPRLLAEEK
ncbi:MAG: Na+:solute symporter [Candidatus Hydrogenedens sp.]|nr:Na+:solute symporter [Candidatus Hydrogenedens sp.]